MRDAPDRGNLVPEGLLVGLEVQLDESASGFRLRARVVLMDGVIVKLTVEALDLRLRARLVLRDRVIVKVRKG